MKYIYTALVMGLRVFGFDIIVTHDGKFHADEITAIALWKAFKNKKVFVIRTRDEELLKLFKELDCILVDVGREYNPEKLLFDHHQDDFDVSSAGMVLRFLNLEKHNTLKALIKRVDSHDLGQKAGAFEYSTLLTRFNHAADLKGALSFANSMIFSLKDEQRRRNKAKEIVNSLELFEDFSEVVILSDYLDEVGIYLNRSKSPEFKGIVTKSPTKKGQWNISVINERQNSFKKWGHVLNPVPDLDMDFVHVKGFFAVANSKDDAIKFLIANGYK